MPHVASDTQTHALKHQQPRASRPAERASSASPFESLIDDGAQAVAKPKRTEMSERATPARDTQGPAKNKPAKAARENDGAQARGETAAVDKTAKPEKADAAKVGSEPVEQTTDAIDAATEAQPQSAPGIKLADIPPIVDTISVPVPAAPVTDLALAPSTLVAETPAAATIDGVPVVGGTAQAEPGAVGVLTGPEKPAVAPAAAKAPAVAGMSDPTASAAAAAKTAQPQPDGVKPHHATPGEGDKQAVAQARGETPAHAQRAAADAPAVANGDAPAPKADFVPPQHLPAPSHAQTAAASAPANPLPAPQPAAVPLQGIAVEIAGKALSGKNHFEIRLDPPELGRIEVRLDIDRDGNVSSRLIADRQDTLDLLRRDAAGLERALQDAGLKTSDNGLQFSLRDQTAQQHDKRQADARLVVADEAMPAIAALPRDYGRLAGRAGGLDIRV